MLIVFEGLDKTGKTTQASLLKDKLVEQGILSTLYREPGSTKFSELIRDQIIKNTEIATNPITDIFTFMGCRSELCNKLSDIKKEELYGSQQIHILDRFKASSYAYQGARFATSNYALNTMLSFINQCNVTASFSIKPQLSFYLKLNLDTVIKRIEESQEKKDKFELLGKKYYSTVQKLYDRYIFENDIQENFHIIDCNDKTVEQLHEEIFTVTKFYFDKLK